MLIEKSISEPLELMYIDPCVPSVVETIPYKKYILVFVDDYTRFSWVIFL